MVTKKSELFAKHLQRAIYDCFESLSFCPQSGLSFLLAISQQAACKSRTFEIPDAGFQDFKCVCCGEAAAGVDAWQY